jgi:SAM-dependent methyltransferase
MENADYTTVTEITGCNVTSEQLQRMYTRYRFASEFCEGKDVLEVACGSGQGLGYLAKKAKRVVGGDYDGKIVKCAKDYYKDRIEIRQLDAHNLPFDNKSFDVLILYEAIYYLAQPEKFVNEAYRVLRDNGVLIMCTANKDWSGFNPSPYTYKYFSAPELFELLKQNEFINVALYGDCPVKVNTFKDRIISAIKKAAVALNLIPKTMKGKELLKRLFMGKLIPLPPEIKDGMTEYTPPVTIPQDTPTTQYKVLFAVGYTPR